MKPKTIENMQYYVGKVCRIFTKPINCQLDEELAREYYSVRVQSLDVDGIWGTHPNNDEAVYFFAMPHVVSIHQGFELDPSNPEHAKIISEMEKKLGRPVESDLKLKPVEKVLEKPKKDEPLLPVLKETPPPEPKGPDDGDAAFVDIESLENLAEMTKRTFDSYNKLRPKKLS